MHIHLLGMNRTKLIQQRNEIVKKLEGKVAVITGGSTGIGLADRKEVHLRGCTCLHNRSPSKRTR